MFEISALTREGCEPLIRKIYEHVHAQQLAEQVPLEIDPRFADADDGLDPSDPRFAPRDED